MLSLRALQALTWADRDSVTSERLQYRAWQAAAGDDQPEGTPLQRLMLWCQHLLWDEGGHARRRLGQGLARRAGGPAPTFQASARSMVSLFRRKNVVPAPRHRPPLGLDAGAPQGAMGSVQVWGTSSAAGTSREQSTAVHRSPGAQAARAPGLQPRLGGIALIQPPKPRQGASRRRFPPACSLAPHGLAGGGLLSPACRWWAAEGPATGQGAPGGSARMCRRAAGLLRRCLDRLAASLLSMTFSMN